MNGFELRLQPVISLPIVLGVTAVLLGLLFVRPQHVQLLKRQWAALIGLRLAVVLLLFFALLRPSFVYTKSEPVPASLVLLVDSSRSMQVADSLGDKSRWDAATRLLDSAQKDIAKLGAKWNVTAYQFDNETKKVDVQDGKLSLDATPNGDESAIGAAITDALDHETSKHVLATLLLSDGAQRATPPRDMPPQIAVRRMAAENIPLYTFTFGKSGSSERADLSVSDLVTNETIFTETPTEVRARLTAEGYANQRVKVQLLWETAKGMEAVDTQQVETGIEGGATPLLLHYTPRKPGEYKVTVRVEPREGELITTNNEASTFVTVRPGGINVLYMVGTQRPGGGPGPEQRFVRAALAQSPDIVVARRLINYLPPEADITDLVGHGGAETASGRAAGPRGSMPAPDVVIVDNVDVNGLNPASWKVIAERVQKGMGLMMTGGYHSFGPGGYRGSPLADVLPIEIGPAQRQAFNEPLRQDVQLPGPLRMRPALPLGARHPVMQIDVAAGGSPAGKM
ncbi:MAG TPA: hypothetical protein VHU84_19685, partial [Lacipirellulaceae bacterium]|nr:hypothetical protein [Lacipirellulaceae bacterium]